MLQVLYMHSMICARGCARARTRLIHWICIRQQETPRRARLARSRQHVTCLIPKSASPPPAPLLPHARLLARFLSHSPCLSPSRSRSRPRSRALSRPRAHCVRVCVRVRVCRESYQGFVTHVLRKQKDIFVYFCVTCVSQLTCDLMRESY